MYEEALDTLKLFSADQTMDPAAYLFIRAVCEHALQRKAEATKSITRLLDEASAISPERYKTVAALMLVDMVSWKDKSLGDIAHKMDNIERRLDIARGGPETQRQQREVLNRLDEIIKKLENQNKNKKKEPGDGSGPPMPGDGQGDQCPDGGNKPGQGPPQGTNPSSSPATESGNAGGQSTGEVDQAKFKKLVADWGRLPPAEQRRALQELVQGMPPRHREAIVNYFQNLTNPALNRKLWRRNGLGPKGSRSQGEVPKLRLGSKVRNSFPASRGSMGISFAGRETEQRRPPNGVWEPGQIASAYGIRQGGRGSCRAANPGKNVVPLRFPGEHFFCDHQ